jgi:hypothetical protein
MTTTQGARTCFAAGLLSGLVPSEAKTGREAPSTSCASGSLSASRIDAR